MYGHAIRWPHHQWHEIPHCAFFSLLDYRVRSSTAGKSPSFACPAWAQDSGTRALVFVGLLEEGFVEPREVADLGSITELGVGFAAASLSNTKDFEELQRSFNRQALGTKIFLEGHRVPVDAEPLIHKGAKY